MEINVPIIIGSIPPKHVRSRASITDHFNQPNSLSNSRQIAPADRVFSEDNFSGNNDDSAMVLFLQNRKERQIQLALQKENYLCDRSDVWI